MQDFSCLDGVCLFRKDLVKTRLATTSKRRFLIKTEEGIKSNVSNVMLLVDLSDITRSLKFKISSKLN